MKPEEWPDDEHDRFIREAPCCDTLTEVFELFPDRSPQEICDKAEAMGLLAMLLHGEYAILGRMSLEAWLAGTETDKAHEKWMVQFNA